VAHTLHLLPRWTAAINGVCVKLPSRRGRVELMEIDLDLKDVLSRVCLDLGSTEA
jgi:hypothetical protein